MARVAGVRIESHIDEITEEMEDKVRAWLLAVGMDASSTTQKIISEIPLVDTGRLKNSIYPVITQPHSIDVGTNVEYAKYHELGTRSLPARHFLNKGTTMHAKEYAERLEQELKQ